MVPEMTSTSQSNLSPLGAAYSAAPVGASAGSTRAVPTSWLQSRLRKHADYQRVYKATRKQFSASMSWFLADQAIAQGEFAVGSTPRVGLTVGKVLGKAHERNLIKRRMREVVRHHLHVLPDGVDLILHPKRMVMTMDFMKLDAEVLRIFRQAAGQVRQAKLPGAKSADFAAQHKTP